VHTRFLPLRDRAGEAYHRRRHEGEAGEYQEADPGGDGVYGWLGMTGTYVVPGVHVTTPPLMTGWPM
jgi:hypothetical protein